MEITRDIIYAGVNDHSVDLFEGQYKVPNGMCYNSYVICDEKCAVMDTVDARFTHEWLDNLSGILKGKAPDYLIIQHMEPDHSANIYNFMKNYPNTTIVSNAKAFAMMGQFFPDMNLEGHTLEVKNGDTLTLGSHVLTFVFAPMVHWPEVMVTYDMTDKILFSADAFGTFGAMNGNIFADEVNFERDWLDDARRYYTNIVGKFGTSVQTLLKKAAGLDIQMICPLHGPVWRENISWYVDKYLTWSSYAPEERAVMIAYGSIYGNTENAANILACRLADRGVRNIAVYDVSSTHPSVLVSEAFRCSHLVFASVTYNGGIFTNMERVLGDLKAHALQNRTVALMENGSWGLIAAKQMKEIISTMKNMEILEPSLSIKSSLKKGQEAEIDAIADAIAASVL